MEGERNRALRSKNITHKVGKWTFNLGFSRTNPSAHQNQSQSSRPQIPHNHQPSGLAELPDSSSGSNYPVTHTQSQTNIRAEPPLITNKIFQSLPQEIGQQAHPMPAEVSPDPEIIIALMGATGTNL